MGTGGAAARGVKSVTDQELRGEESGLQKSIAQRVKDCLIRSRRYRMWKKIVGALACVVVFCTVYALILPAITLEKAPQCGEAGHTHSAACSVIRLIDALPIRQSVEERVTAFQETGNEAGSNAYLAGLQAQVQKACEAYAALPEEERLKVTNVNRLTALEWLRVLTLPESATVTVTNEENRSADVAPWTDDTSAAYRYLQAAMFSTGQGYAIRSIGYYRITGLTGSRASVTYTNGGLSAGDGGQVFVYDLGVDGTATPQACSVTNAARDAQTGLFTGFDFEIPAEREATAHIYAFLSASPAALEEMGIYLGTKQPDGSWVAWDAAQEDSAGVKATVTLPEGVTEPEGYSLFIRRINEGEGFYPDAAAVRARAGAFNGWQCYTIRWMKQDDNGSLHMLPLNTGGNTATVRIEYLKEASRLPGPAGARKLLIFNSNADGSLSERVADSVENVRVADDGYTSFTFHAAQAGPYVFVSKKLEMGYIDALNIEKIVDGSAPFDNTDTPGNDSGADNLIVRSYDAIQYNLAATFAARQEGVTSNAVNMFFELTLRKSSTAARFDISKMLWLGENYSIEYLDNDGNVIMILAHDGKYYSPQRDENGNVLRDEHGFARADTGRKPISINAQVNGSTAGPNSYKVTGGGVAMQRLVGWTTLHAKPGESILSGTQAFTTAVEVRNADHGEIFAPTFKMWLEGNEGNYGAEGTEGETMLPAQPDMDNVVTAPEVKVSAGTNFNIQVKKNTDMSYKNWFDFSAGQAVPEPVRSELVRLARLPENHGRSNPAEFTENGAALPAELQAQYANYRYGRITCYGITLQLYNDTDNAPADNRAAKGLKGLSLPVGDINFDLKFYSTVNSTDASASQNEYPAILWDYNENIPADTSYSYSYVDPGRGKVTTPNDGKGNGGRNLYWDGETRSPYAKGGAPSNYIFYHDGCYYGGDWAFVDENGQKTDLHAIASPTAVTGTGAGTTYHFSVSDYDFDFDNRHFPLRNAGNSGNVTGYDTYSRCFSAGCVQVLSVFPMVQEVSEAEVFLNVEASNLRLKTRAGQDCNREVTYADNSRRDQIVLYAPGHLTKGNAFNGMYRSRPPKTTGEGFLGTEYWTTSYDCSAYAGDEIWIMSYGMMASGSDFRTRSMNLLQLFDSRALSVRDEPVVYRNVDPQFDKAGEATFLYAADPNYPGGYDTNHQDENRNYDVLDYMNTVREEDLKYYTSLDALEADGYTCVGVLMELRHCDLLGGKYQYMSIPVKVNGDDERLVGKTVATVNTFRTWSFDLVDENNQTITWANGKWDDATGRNTLKGFPKPKNGIVDDEYSGEIANSQKSPPHYVKTEYQDGLQVEKTHVGGTLAGNSLLILSYRAEVDIAVDNKGDSGAISYNIGNGETVVDYRLRNIKTVVSDPTGQTEHPVTDLTIRAVLDEGHTGVQRISVSGGSYQMMGYAVDSDGNVAGEATNLSIGSDPNHPTVLEFEADGKRHRIRVYAQLGANNQSVTFAIQDAPVGLQLPDITFQANFAAITALNDNDTIRTGAYISGQGDNRAYDQAKGNTDNVTVGVIKGSGTNLTKAVNTHYIELDDTITYNVTYTNSGTETIGKIYFYDLLPRDRDIRGSMFQGNVVLREFDVTSSMENNVPPANATVYYSTTEYWELYNTVRVFGGAVGADGAIGGMDAENVDTMLEQGKNKNGELLFEPLGRVVNGQFEYDAKFKSMQLEEINALMRTVTGLYVKAEKLHMGQTINLKITVETEKNKADNWYKNIANSWIADSKTVPLTSNKVETRVISRRISGVVWYDRNFNGIRDDDEPRLEGVTATLFRKVNGSYELCTKDVTGQPIGPLVTNERGEYSFDKLADGDYVVAFSGEILAKFTNATTYQQNGTNDANTSDGVATAGKKGKTFDAGAYAYFIRYSVNSAHMTLHSIEEMGNVRLNNGVEEYANQDLGLVIATHELPAAGGSGTTPYILGGLLLCALGVLLTCNRWLHRREEFPAI